MAASTLFQFFSYHQDPQLAGATREAARAEFADHGWDPGTVPDPQDPETFERSKLNWAERESGQHARMLALYRDLIALRRDEPDLADFWLDHMEVEFDEDASWIVLHRGGLAIACNLGPGQVVVPVTGDVVSPGATPASAMPPPRSTAIRSPYCARGDGPTFSRFPSFPRWTCGVHRVAVAVLWKRRWRCQRT